MHANNVPHTPDRKAKPNPFNRFKKKHLKPQQSPSIVAELIAWQRRRVCCRTLQRQYLTSGERRARGMSRLVLWFVGNIRNSVGTASNGSAAGAAVPDTDRLSSDGGLSAEGAGVLGVLGDFHLLHLLSQGGTVTIASCVSCQFIWRFPSACDRFRVSRIKSRRLP